MHKYRLDYYYYMHHSDEYDTITDYIWETGRDELEFNAINDYEYGFCELKFRADVIIHNIWVIDYSIKDGELNALIEVTYEITKRGEL